MNNASAETLIEAITYFADPQAAHDFMVKLRWPDGVVKCPRCGTDRVGFIATRRMWECRCCTEKKQFSVKVGTIFEDSPLPLGKWLAAIWMIANDKNGISSYEVHRGIGVTQKTAWFMLHRIRLAMKTGTFEKFSGEVEADETYVGGKGRNMHKSRKSQSGIGTGGVGKAIVMGLLERHTEQKPSRVRLKHVPNAKRGTVQAEIRQHVAPGSEVFTDALRSYNQLGPDYIHKAIDHAECYAKGRIHTNGMENFWSLLKRAIRGTYVSVDAPHLFRYLDEEAFRFNEREKNDGQRFLAVAGAVTGKRLTYAKLIGEEKPA